MTTKDVRRDAGAHRRYGAVPLGRAAQAALGSCGGPYASALARQTKVRTFQPVRRSSYDAGDRRAQVFQPIGAGDPGSALRWCDKLVQTAREFDRVHKEHGRRLGPLGDSALVLLETIVRRCLDFASGRCEPAIETLMRYTRYARATVVAALRRLKRHGFLAWVRRTVRTDNAPGEGPQVRQISNAYFFDLTRLAGEVRARFRQLLGGRAALAEEAREAERRRALSEAVASAPPSTVGTILAGSTDPALAAVLDRLGKALEEREAQAQGNAGHSASSVNELNPPSIS